MCFNYKYCSEAAEDSERKNVSRALTKCSCLSETLIKKVLWLLKIGVIYRLQNLCPLASDFPFLPLFIILSCRTFSKTEVTGSSHTSQEMNLNRLTSCAGRICQWCIKDTQFWPITHPKWQLNLLHLVLCMFGYPYTHFSREKKVSLEEHVCPCNFVCMCFPGWSKLCILTAADKESVPAASPCLAAAVPPLTWHPVL